MAYSPQTWVNGALGGTPISAARLGVMESGIAGVVQGSATDAGFSVTAALSATGMPNSGTSGFRVSRSALGQPVGMSLLTGAAPEWDSPALDYLTGDLILGYRHPRDRTVTDGVLNSTTTVTSATANFTTADEGQVISGTGIPAGTRVFARVSATQVTMTAAATATASGVTLVMGIDGNYVGDHLRMSPNGRMHYGRNMSSPSTNSGTFSVLSTTTGRDALTFGIVSQPYGAADAPINFYAPSRGNVAAFSAYQMAAGTRRVQIDLGGSVGKGWRWLVDTGLVDTNDMGLYDNVAGLFRLTIGADGISNFNSNTVVGGGFLTGTGAVSRTHAVHVHGATVSTGTTGVRLNNTGGRDYELTSGITGVSESGLSLRDRTAAVDRIVVTAAGTVRLGTAGDIATTATDAFVRIPTMNGAPTGVPTAYGGDSGGALVFDRSNGRLWVYIAGIGWRGTAALTV